MVAHNSAVERLADRNIRKWVLAEHVQARLKQGKVDDNVGPYVAISRETGAGGSEIARLVSQQLGWDVLDREIISYLAEKYGTPRDLVEFVDEKRANWLEDLYSTWIEGKPFTVAKIASYMRVPRSTVIRRLNRLQNWNLIYRQGRHYYLHEKTLNSLIGMRSYQQVRRILREAAEELAILDASPD